MRGRSSTGRDRGAREEGSRGRRLLPYVAGRDAMLVVISSAAGSVDAMVYLGVRQIFPANMTGNTVLLGIALGRGDLSTFVGAGIALAGFFFGAAAGAAVVERGREDVVWPSVVTAALALECAFLVAFAVGWNLVGEPDGGATYLLVAPVAVAMGVQGAAVRRLGVPGISATFVTGTLASLATRMSDRLRLALAQTSGPAGQAAGRPARERSSTRGLVEPAAVLLAYGVGATAGSVTELRWGPGAVVLPVALVAVVVVAAAILYR